MTDNSLQTAAQGQNHTRVNNTWIGRSEKIVLLWLAARMPAWVTPDTLTAIGFAGSLLIFAGYALTTYHRGYLWLASLGFVIQWFGDSLDGTLARYRKIERPRYGFFIDHIIDVISEALVFVGLGISPYLRFDIAIIALASYLMGSVYVLLNTYVTGIFRLTYGGLGPTEYRLIAVATNLVVFFAGNPVFYLPHIGPLPTALTLYDLVVGGVAVYIQYLFLLNTIRTSIRLDREDRLSR